MCFQLLNNRSSALVSSGKLLMQYLPVGNCWCSTSQWETVDAVLPSGKLLMQYFPVGNCWFSTSQCETVDAVLPSAKLLIQHFPVWNCWCSTSQWETVDAVLPSGKLLIRHFPVGNCWCSTSQWETSLPGAELTVGWSLATKTWPDHTKDLKNDTCGLTSLALGVNGRVRGSSSRAVLRLTRRQCSIHCERSGVARITSKQRWARRLLVTLQEGVQKTSINETELLLGDCLSAVSAVKNCL